MTLLVSRVVHFQPCKGAIILRRGRIQITDLHTKFTD